MSVHTWGGSGPAGGVRSSQPGGQVQPGGGGSGPAGGGQVQPGGGQVQLAGGVSQWGGVSILRPLAGGMPLAFTQEVFLIHSLHGEASEKIDKTTD